MIMPSEADKIRRKNIQDAIDRFEADIDSALTQNTSERWPVFVTQAEDQTPEVVEKLIPKYVMGGWRCWYKPGGFLYLAPRCVPIDDTRHPMGKKYE